MSDHKRNTGSGVDLLVFLTIATIVWISGIILAKGTLNTLLALFVVPYAFFIVGDHILTLTALM